MMTTTNHDRQPRVTLSFIEYGLVIHRLFLIQKGAGDSGKELDIMITSYIKHFIYNR